MNKKILLVLISVIIFPFAQQRDSIVRVGACATPLGHPRDVVTASVYAHVADGDALATIDCSVPSNPTVTAYNSSIWMEAEGVNVTDTLAFINAGGGGSFTIAIVKPPDTITRIGYRSCVMSIPPLPWGVGVRDTIGFMAGGDLGLWIFNISDLINPTLIDTFNTPGHLLDFFIKDTLLYAADRDSLLIFNIADPANVHIIGTISVPEDVYDVFVDSIYAYLACRSTFGTNGRMKIVNVSNPTNPELLGEELFNGDGRAIFVANDYVYVAAEDWWFSKKKRNGRADVEGGVRIFKPEDPYNPTFMCGYDTPGNPHELHVQSDLIFVADYDSLQILRHIPSAINEEIAIDIFDIESSLKIYPIPFSKVVNIAFTLPFRQQVLIEVFDLQGRNVKAIYKRGLQPGRYVFYWHGTDNNGQKVPAGVYFIKFTAGDNSFSKKVLFVKE